MTSLVWLDALTPKQARLCSVLYTTLEEDGREAIVTARRHAETLGILELEGIPHRVVGAHGGPTRLGKLMAHVERSERLADIISGLDTSVLISLSSPSAVRVAFGLGVPSISLNDTPHAIHVGRLTLALSTRVVSPKAIPIRELLRLGASKRTVIQYDGVDEVAWMSRREPSETVLDQLGIEEDRPLVLLRPSESQAAYLAGMPQEPFSNLLQFLIEEGARVVFFPRYSDHESVPEKSNRVIIPSKVVDTVSLYHYSSLVISGGGTMSREGALAGVPSISLFPLDYPLYVNDYLAERGFPIWRFPDISDALPLIRNVLRNPADYRVDPSDILADLEDPIIAIGRAVREASPSVQG